MPHPSGHSRCASQTGALAPCLRGTSRAFPPTVAFSSSTLPKETAFACSMSVSSSRSKLLQRPEATFFENGGLERWNRGYDLQAGGLPDGSRGLSEATPPVNDATNSHPGGVQESWDSHVGGL